MRVFKVLIICISITLFSCSSDSDNDNDPVIVGGPTNPTGNPDDSGDGGSTANKLKDAVNFPIGNIVSTSKLASSSSDNTTFKEILLSEFNSITAENDMKTNNMFLAPGSYDWSDGDAIVTYAKANGLKVHGHALAWHSQQPGWYSSFSGTDAEFETAVMDYITAAVAHFAEEKDSDGNSIVRGWDVFNEAHTSDAATNVLFTKIDDVVAKSFIAARAGDPTVKLFYNDYNIAGDTAKRSNIISMVNEFLSRTPQVPIDGIGLQMHLNYNWPTTDVPNAIQDIADTGLLVHVSELDVRANQDNDISSLTTAREQEQVNQFQYVAYYYTTTVPAAQQYGITIWGFRDQDSWRYNNGADWPLLYDNDFETKTTYDAFLAGLEGQNVQ